MFSSSVRTVLDLRAAIDDAPKKLQPIGSCISMIKEWQDGYGTSKTKVPKPIKTLAAIYKDQSRTMLSGYLPNAFDLIVKGEGVDLSVKIQPFGEPGDDLTDGARKKKPDVAMLAETSDYLKKLFDGGVVSGYGDVRSQSTRVDDEVRNAREISSEHFTVSPSLYEDIERVWSENFLPGSVRIEPYKLHLYGPGGCFRPHWDTPEKNLAGTFLVGIGDCTTGDEGNLRVGGKQGMRAHPGSFVTFYPDIEHEVEKVKGGYRGVIAFKVFTRTSDAKSPAEFKARTEIERRVLEKMKVALSKLTPSYGILLQHRYSIETSELSGMDNLLYAAASSLSTSSTEVHFLPVLMHFKSSVPDDWEPGDNDPVPASAYIFPLTDLHVDALRKSSMFRNPAVLAKKEYEQNLSIPGPADHHSYIRNSTYDDDDSEDDSDEDEDEDSPNASNAESQKSRWMNRLEVDVSGTPYAWLRFCKKVPFYSLQKTADKLSWSVSFEMEDPEYFGNESRPDSADSIYLSYAMVVVSNKKRKRGDSDEGERDS